MIKITHSLPVWLPRTQNWMYHQLKRHQTLDVEHHFACQATENLDQFNLGKYSFAVKVVELSG